MVLPFTTHEYVSRCISLHFFDETNNLGRTFALIDDDSVTGTTNIFDLKIKGLIDMHLYMTNEPIKHIYITQPMLHYLILEVLVLTKLVALLWVLLKISIEIILRYHMYMNISLN